MNLKDKLSTIVMEKAYSYIAGNPVENLPKLMKWADELDKADNWKVQREVFREVLNQPDNNWYQYILGLFEDIDREVLKTTFRNFFINASMLGFPAQRKNRHCSWDIGKASLLMKIIYDPAHYWIIRKSLSVL